MADVKKELQTDKKETKECPCTYPGCDVTCIVNLFYAPYKARCSAHKGKTSQAMRAAAATTQITTAVEEKDIVPNGALAMLLCPLCHSALTLEQITNQAGFMTFVCSKPGRCGTVVTVKLNFAWAVVKAIPDAWKPFAEAFNSLIKAKAKELENEYSAPNT